MLKGWAFARMVWPAMGPRAPGVSRSMVWQPRKVPQVSAVIVSGSLVGFLSGVGILQSFQRRTMCWARRGRGMPSDWRTFFWLADA